MKVISALLLAFSCFTVKAQNIQFLDSNLKKVFITRNVVDTSNLFGSKINMDTNGDGEIQISEALAVEYLTIGAYKDSLIIRQLDDLSKFTNLKRLIVTHADSLSSISNLNLTSLISYQSSANYSLKKIDLSDCPNLKVIRIEDQDSLDYVNIRNGSYADSIYSFFYTNYISEICIDSIAAEFNGIGAVTGSIKFNCVTSLSEEKEGNVIYKVLPNPSEGAFKVQSKEKILELRILNLSGQMLKSVSADKIEITDFPNGVYLLQIILKGRTFNRKIIKNAL